jgi:RNA polymerase sigma-70 factor (ECF subfamily)
MAAPRGSLDVAVRTDPLESFTGPARGTPRAVTLEPLLHRVAAGDPNAVQEVIDRYGGLVWSLARRFCPDKQEAEDAAQEVFIEIWNKAPRYDAALASEITFIAMIARRRLIDRGRRKQRADGLEDESILPAEDKALELVDVGDEAARARKALAKLRPDEQKVLRMAIYDGLSHDQIAKATTMPLGTVKTHLRRGLQRVREMLGVELEAEGEASA